MPNQTPSTLKVIDWKIMLAMGWLLFTVSLAIWWTRLGLQYLGPKKEMILGEGATLIVCLTLGGVALIYYIVNERRKNQETNAFFASANHELKTYMASLRLRAEGLEEDLQGERLAEDAQKIVRDTVRLELQLENSLLFSEPGKKQIFLEALDLPTFIKQIHSSLSPHQLHITGTGEIQADRRMLRVIIKNIIQNALVHALAQNIYVSIVKTKDHKTHLTFTNDGEPFAGQLDKCGVMFYRHQHKSRSGIGLYLVKTLMEQLKGQVEFSVNDEQRFCVHLVFPGGAL